MKGKFSLNRLLHNDRFILIFSLLGAIAVWALVSFGPSNISSREITAQVKVDLTNTIVGYNDLRVIGEDTFTVTVTVEGPRSVIFNLNSDDIYIKPNISEIQGTGKTDLQLIASKSGKSTDYTIVGLSPSTVSVECDYWSAADFYVATDVSSIKVADEMEQQLGDVVLDTAAVPNGLVRIEGPRTVINQIASIVAKVDTTETISKTTRYSARLLALDAQGSEVDLTNCVFRTPSTGIVDITVPVWVQKQVQLTYQLLNVPTGLDKDDLISLSVDTVTLVGEEDVLNTIAATVANLGTFDFDRLLPENKQVQIALNVPDSVKVLEGTVVTVDLAIDKYTTKELSLTVNGVDDVTVQNLAEGKTLTIQKQILSDIVLCGKAATLNKIKATDLELAIDAAANSGIGSVRYDVRINVPNYPDVWVYYGDNEQSGYKLYGSIE